MQNELSEIEVRELKDQIKLMTDLLIRSKGKFSLLKDTNIDEVANIATSGLIDIQKYFSYQKKLEHLKNGTLHNQIIVQEEATEL